MKFVTENTEGKERIEDQIRESCVTSVRAYAQSFCCLLKPVNVRKTRHSLMLIQNKKKTSLSH